MEKTEPEREILRNYRYIYSIYMAVYVATHEAYLKSTLLLPDSADNCVSRAWLETCSLPPSSKLEHRHHIITAMMSLDPEDNHGC